jgi:hypothetical protein
VSVASGELADSASRDLKLTFKRIVLMLTRMAMKFDGARESTVDYARAIDHEHEHRDAEHEHERKPEPGDPPKIASGRFGNGKFFPRSG